MGHSFQVLLSKIQPVIQVSITKQAQKYPSLLKRKEYLLLHWKQREQNMMLHWLSQPYKRYHNFSYKKLKRCWLIKDMMIQKSEYSLMTLALPQIFLNGNY